MFEESSYRGRTIQADMTRAGGGGMTGSSGPTDGASGRITVGAIGGNAHGISVFAYILSVDSDCYVVGYEKQELNSVSQQPYLKPGDILVSAHVYKCTVDMLNEFVKVRCVHGDIVADVADGPDETVAARMIDNWANKRKQGSIIVSYGQHSFSLKESDLTRLLLSLTTGNSIHLEDDGGRLAVLSVDQVHIMASHAITKMNVLESYLHDSRKIAMSAKTLASLESILSDATKELEKLPWYKA